MFLRITCPILSAIGTPTYNLAKFLAPILSPLTVSEFTVKDSFSFAEEIIQQNCHCHMASFDVNSLFTNIPLDETIEIIMNDIDTSPDGTVCGTFPYAEPFFRPILNRSIKSIPLELFNNSHVIFALFL